MSASPISDRLEFKKARQEAGLTAWDVDDRAGIDRGTCANFEWGERALSDRDEHRLVLMLQVLVEHDCQAKVDYKSAVIAYRRERGLSRTELARISGLSPDVIRNIEREKNKRGVAPRTREKLDAVLFDA